MSALRDFANRFPRLKRVAKSVAGPFRSKSVSSHYVELSGIEAGAEASRLRGSWQDASIPARQRKLVDEQLKAFHRGERIDNFAVMQRSLRDLHLAAGPASLLEVGCSSGYYSEIIASVAPGFTYVGCDYSSQFIDMARKHYPALRFDVEDASRLSYASSSFDVVVSGCCLLHMPEYRAGVAETARVARIYTVFHRTPVVIGQPEKVFRKQAYGVETVEIHFNEPDFLALLAVNGLEPIAIHTLSESITGAGGSAVRTYVCRKVST